MKRETTGGTYAIGAGATAQPTEPVRWSWVMHARPGVVPPWDQSQGVALTLPESGTVTIDFVPDET